MLAAKFNERDENLVKISELQKECKYNFTFKNITSCETKIIQELKWNLLIQTPLHYVKLFYSAGVVFTSDVYSDEITSTLIGLNDITTHNNTTLKECIKSVRKYADYFVDLSINDYFMLQFDEQIVAMACIVCARKNAKIQPEFSDNFVTLYGISEEMVREVVDRLWTFYQTCIGETVSKDTTSVSPMKLKDSRNLLREGTTKCQSPNMDSKKCISLMPSKIKTNKITFSDLETPQERNKPEDLKNKIRNAQGFSDLHPIVEESSKNIPTNIQDHQQTKQLEIKISSAVKKQRIGLFKASSQMIDAESPTRKLNNLTRAISSTTPTESAETVTLYLNKKNADIEQESVESPTISIHSKITVKDSSEYGESESRVPMHEKDAHSRENKNQNKSNRRNRNERMKSAHSSKRTQEPTKETKKPKSFAMKHTTSRVLPKV